MADYFFLPRIRADIDAECDLTCMVSNRRSKASAFAPHKAALYLQRHGETVWRLIDQLHFDTAIRRTVSSLDYDLAVGEVAVGVPLPLDADMPKELTALPRPHSRRNDAAPIEERVAIRFVHAGARSSYQGDYPSALAQRLDGSLVSLGSLVLGQPRTAQTFAAMVNICSSALADKRRFAFAMYAADTREVLASVAYEHNSACCIAVPPALNGGGREVFFASRHTTGIPIFVTVAESGGGTTLSIEHTHPPHEYFWQRDRMQGGAIVKQAWLEKAMTDA